MVMGLVSSLLSAIEGKFKGSRVMLFTIGKKIVNKTKQHLMKFLHNKGLLLNNFRVKPSTAIYHWILLKIP